MRLLLILFIIFIIIIIIITTTIMTIMTIIVIIFIIIISFYTFTKREKGPQSLKVYIISPVKTLDNKKRSYIPEKKVDTTLTTFICIEAVRYT